MNKKLALILSLLVTLIGTFLLGLYAFKIYYDPDQTNGQNTVIKYKEYVIILLQSILYSNFASVKTNIYLQTNIFKQMKQRISSFMIAIIMVITGVPFAFAGGGNARRRPCR